jgi:hypothetical protein
MERIAEFEAAPADRPNDEPVRGNHFCLSAALDNTSQISNFFK